MRIKAIICVLSLLLTFAFSLVSCNKAEKNENKEEIQTQVVDIDALKARSIEIADAMAEGNFETAWAYISESYKNSLNKDEFINEYYSKVADIGNYINYNDVSHTKTGNYYFVKVILEYAVGGISVQFNYDTDLLISGIYVDRASLTSSARLTDNDYLTEISVIIGKTQPLNGILTVPKDKKFDSCAILIPGSGAYDMNETVGKVGNKPLRDIAHALAKKGVATLRYDKRGYTYPNTVPEKATVYTDTVDDFMLALDYLKEDEMTKEASIWIVGHGFGGMIAPKLAYDNEDINGIVILGGSPRGLQDILLDQKIFILEDSSTYSEDEKSSLLAKYRSETDKINNITEDNNNPLYGINGAFWYSLKNFKGEDYVAKLDIPVLVLHAQEDFSVFSIDFEKFQKLLSKKKNAECIEYPGLNHMFMKYNGKYMDSSEYDFPDTVSIDVTNDIARFIKDYSSEDDEKTDGKKSDK